MNEQLFQYRQSKAACLGTAFDITPEILSILFLFLNDLTIFAFYGFDSKLIES
jgi:hypothetical protein